MRNVLPLVLLILLAPTARAGSFGLEDPLPGPLVLECPSCFQVCPTPCELPAVASEDGRPPWALIGIAVAGLGAIAWALWPSGDDSGSWQAFPHDTPSTEPFVCDDCDDIIVVPTPPAVWMGLLGLLTALWWWRRP